MIPRTRRAGGAVSSSKVHADMAPTQPCRTTNISETPTFPTPESTPQSVRAFEQGSFEQDLWAVGVLMYEMVTGEHPFLGAAGGGYSAGGSGSIADRRRWNLSSVARAIATQSTARALVRAQGDGNGDSNGDGKRPLNLLGSGQAMRVSFDFSPPNVQQHALNVGNRLSPKFCAIVRRALAPDPTQRFDSALQMVAALREVAQHWQWNGEE